MEIIGLTGGYCAGKNEVANILASHGWDIIDVDRLGHEALQQSAQYIKETFGTEVFHQDGSIDRKALGAIVFADPARMQQLESIVHPAMFGLLDSLMDQHLRKGTEHLCINAALLYRFPHLRSCSAVIEVKAPLLVRISRARQRDGVSTLQALKRIMAQRALWHLRPQPPFPIYKVSNYGSLLMLANQVEKVLLALMRSKVRGKTSF